MAAPSDDATVDSGEAAAAPDGAAAACDSGAGALAADSDAEWARDADADASDAGDSQDAASASAVTGVGVGNTSTCAAIGDGSLVCWGALQYDSTGMAACNNAFACVGPEAIAGFSAPVKSVDLGLAAACAVLADGHVACWGEAASASADAGTTTPVPIAGLSGVASVSVGGNGLHPAACAVTVGGAVQCWGNGPIVSASAPVAIGGLSSAVTAVSLGATSACVLTAGGGVMCWGTGSVVSSPTPTPIAGLSSAVTAVSVGWDSACALVGGGSVVCWGANGSGELGAMTPATSATPVQVPGLTLGFTSVAVGGAFACAVDDRGGVTCWGDNEFGNLGFQTANLSEVPPGPVQGLEGPATQVFAGYPGHYCGTVCAILVGGRVACWGDNIFSQVTGDPTAGGVRNVPIPHVVTGF